MLLADRIAHNDLDQYPEDFQYNTPLDQDQIDQIAAAKKFFFTRASMLTAYEIFKLPSWGAAKRFFPFCVLPYPLCWFECPDREGTQRLGYLCEAEPGAARITAVHHDGWYLYRIGLPSGEIGPYGALGRMLLMLNARGAVHREQVDKTRHNEKRRRKGKAPFSSYEICHVRAPRISAEGQVGTRGQTRLHEVRRHLKVHSDKIVICPEHWRGDASLGVVTKEYHV